MSDLILPPAGQPKRFAVDTAKLRKIAILVGLYLLIVMYPAFAFLRHSWGHPPTTFEMGGAAIFALFYVGYALREMKKLTIVPQSPQGEMK